MKALTAAQVKAVLTAARESSTRDWCMFLLTFRHALRSREARELKLDDIDMNAQTIAVNRCKGSKSGVQALDRHKGEPLLDEVVALKAWLKERIEDGSKSLFPSAKGGVMTRMQFLRLFKEYALAAASRPNWLTRTSSGIRSADDGRTARRHLRHPTTCRPQEHLQHDDLHPRQ